MTYSPAFNLLSETEYWVPEPMFWEDTGVTCPVRTAQCFRVGATLYLFGGYDAAAASPATIWSAAYDATGTTPVFTSTGSTLPAGNCLGGRIALLGTTLYMFGARYENGGAGAFLWSAPISTPTTWTNLGSSVLVNRRDNAPHIVSTTRVGIISGHDGAVATNDTRYRTIASPNGAWIISDGGNDSANHESGAFRKAGIVNGCGSVSATGNLYSAADDDWTQSATRTWRAAQTGMLTGGTSTPEMFDLGTEVIIIGANSLGVETCDVDGRFITSGIKVDAVMPAAMSTNQYIYGQNWIGGDGRAYFVQQPSRKIYRSLRRKVFVPNSIVTASVARGPYVGLRGRFADGSLGIVSSHVRMGVSPWWVEGGGTHAAF